jgi:hypothetical protein
MPTYTFRNNTTGQEWDEFLSFSGREARLEDPNITQVPCAPAIISGVSGITHKNDSGFNDMMSRIATANPTSPLADRYGDKGVKASKTRDLVKKARSTMTP